MVSSKRLSRASFLLIFPIFLGLLLGLPAFGQVAPPNQPPATIYLIRHAEKLTDGREDLSWQGFLRAAAIPRNEVHIEPIPPARLCVARLRKMLLTR